MDSIQTVTTQEKSYTRNDARNVFFSKSDGVIDDVENGRVVSEEDRKLKSEY